MKDNILGGLVIFVVVVTCLLMLDDISNAPKQDATVQNVESVDTIQNENPNDLAIIEIEE